MTFRLLPAERTQVEAYADAAEQTLGTFIRSRLLAAPAMRARRRPSVEVIVLTRLLAALNKIGGTLNQIARHLNFGDTPLAADIRASLQELREAVVAVLRALDRGPDEEPGR